MNGQWVTSRQRDFRGGETQARLPEEVGRNQLIRMENAMLYPSGELTAAHQTDTEVITGATLGVCIVNFTDGTYNVFSAPGNGIVYGQFFETSLESPVQMALGSQASVVGSRIVGAHKSIRFLNKEYCPNPNDDNTKDGILNLTDFTLINIPAGGVASKLRLYANRLWLISTTGELRNSNNGDASVWNPLNIMLLANSEPIVDFHPVPGGAIVYSATAIYAMYGTTYQDISFIPLMQGKRFTTASVEVGGIVYILSSEGVYQVALNGAQLIPHHQETFFEDNHGIFADPAKILTAFYLQAFRAIVFTWPDAYSVGGKSLVFYLSGAYSKLNKLLPSAFPYAVALNDKNTDFLWGTSAGVFAKSQYPSANTLIPYESIVQTRHEDCNSYRDKVWNEFVLTFGEVVYGVTIEAMLDESTDRIMIVSGNGCRKGDNTFYLDDLPRSKTISMVITINNGDPVTLASDDNIEDLLTDENGNMLTAAINPGNWTLKAMRLRYRDAGPVL